MKSFHSAFLRIASLSCVGLATLVPVAPAHAALETFSATGSNATDIQSTVDSFRTVLGTLNPNVSGSAGSGRREINWDGVPDALSAPNNLPANFFNVNSPRGVVFSTPGSGFQVSATAASGTPIEFGNINASYPTLFTTFSPQRLFTALDSNIVDVNFFIPGGATPAFTTGFGAVFTDVDLANTTSIQFFDLTNALIGTVFAPNTTGNGTLSFAGGVFNAGEQIGRIRLTSGNAMLGSNEALPGVDLVVMDDFIYGEPRAIAAVPEPAAAIPLALGLLLLAGYRRKSA